MSEYDGLYIEQAAEIDRLKAELAAAIAGAETWKANFECMERAGAEQARRADQTAADLAAAREEVERYRVLDAGSVMIMDKQKAELATLRALCAEASEVANPDEFAKLRRKLWAAGRGEGER